MISLLRRTSTFAAAALLAVTPQIASAQNWTTWTNADAAGVYGTLGSTSVSWLGGYASWQGTGGTNYWSFFPDQVTPSSAYTQGGYTAPSNTSFVQLINATRGSIVFSAPVVNPIISLISVGQGGQNVGYAFSDPFTVVSNNNSPNCAYWGCGSSTVAGNTLTGYEFSGTLQFTGTFTSIGLATINNENWHGFTVGAQNPSTSTVPEPSSYALMAAGLAGLGVVARRRRQAR